MPRDEYYNRAKQEGYRSRAAYKLKQLDDLEDVISPGDTVVDLGAAPGGWLQVATERVGDEGTVIGVDRQRIDPLEDVEATVELIRGDITEADTRERILEVAGGEVDVVLSDMAPNVSGEYSLDRARSHHLASLAAETAAEVLTPGGHLVVKIFDGPEVSELRADLEADYRYVRATSPDASRDESSEVYLLAIDRLTAPVTAGEDLTVTIEDQGREGDGIARVDGFTVFVPDTEVGAEVDVRIEDVKPRYAFATRRE